MDIPYGFCKCGCGNKTTIAKQSSTHHGHVKGEPVGYLMGHASRTRWGTPIDRFWSLVRKGHPDRCWPWAGDIQAYGYGRFYWEGRQQIASRVMWQIINGHLEEGDCVCHKCDNPRCVNPSHLFVGTKGDNNRDKCAKGRDKSPYGMAHSRAKLTDDGVIEIRRAYKAGEETQVSLAAKYGVSRRAIRMILDGSRWRHLPI
jgi:hypothetical protein